jgi:hypothetical protein
MTREAIDFPGAKVAARLSGVQSRGAARNAMTLDLLRDWASYAECRISRRTRPLEMLRRERIGFGFEQRDAFVGVGRGLAGQT